MLSVGIHPSPRRARPGPALILALACLPVFIGALDLTVISAVLPAVIADLRVPLQSGLNDAAWAVSGYLLAYAISMTFMGRVSDVWGRRRVYLICLTVFFAGSWLVAASSGAPAAAVERMVRLLAGGRPDRSLMALYALIGGRVVQAFGAGALVPVTMALAGDLYPAHRRAVALGVIGAVDTAGWVLGHLYGGILVQFVPWTYLFWINLPIAAVSFGLVGWALRDLAVPPGPDGIDWAGAVLLGLALTGLNLGLGVADPAARTGARASSPLAAAIGVLAFVGFLLQENRARRPLVNLKFFTDRSLAAAGGANLLVGYCLMVGLVSVPLFINLAGAESGAQGALASGVLLSAFTIPMALAAVLGGWLASRYGDRLAAAAGVLIALAGFGLMTRWQPQFARQAAQFVAGLGEPVSLGREVVEGVAGMALGLVLAGVGLGLTFAPIGSTVINGVQDSERGMASALVIVLRLVGMSLSVSTLTSYGLRRSTVLSQRLLEGVQLTELGRIAEVGIQVATRVTVEMAGIAVGVCALALIPALLIRRESIRRAPAQAASSQG